MPIGVTEYGEDLGQDYRPPPDRPPIPMTPVARPGAAAVASPFLSPDEAQRQLELRRLRYAIQDAPIEQAEAAVNAALKFQAQRGYRRDLQAGVPAAEALMKWGPSMFGSTAGTAGALGRLARPEPEKYMDIGGVGYQMKGGRAIPLTTAKPKTIPMQVPVDPQNPLTGGHFTVPLDERDPLVVKALERALQGPAAEAVEPPNFWTRLGNKILPPSNAPGVAPTTEPAARITAPAPAAPARQAKLTPEQKLDAARELRRQHPDWTKKQILDAVNK